MTSFCNTDPTKLLIRSKIDGGADNDMRINCSIKDNLCGAFQGIQYNWGEQINLIVI